MRLFIGVPIAPEVRRALRKAAREAGLGEAGWRLSAEETLHMTLAFLGETEPAAFTAVLGAVRRAAEGVREPLALRAERLTGYPSPNRARVATVELAEGLERRALAEVAETLRRGLAEAGVAFDARPFRPHITVARASRGPLPVSGSEIQPPIPVAAAAVTIWESRLEKPHAVHIPLATVGFGTSQG